MWTVFQQADWLIQQYVDSISTSGLVNSIWAYNEVKY